MALVERFEGNEIIRAHGTPFERFSVIGQELVREVTAGPFTSKSRLPVTERISTPATTTELRKIWWLNRLRGMVPAVDGEPSRPEIEILDFFSGCGGLATGVKWACEAVGLRPVFRACVDVSRQALAIYIKNLRPLLVLEENVANLVDYDLAPQLEEDGRAHYPPRIIHPELGKRTGSVDLFIAGPPCEGNSNFNNKSRRTDDRNELYVTAVACAIALKARVVVIENVVGVKHARQNVVDRAVKMLHRANYKIRRNDTVLEASSFGTPQRRRRHFLIASKRHDFDAKVGFDGLQCPSISALDAIGDLIGIDAVRDFDQPSNLSAENERRARFLTDNDLYELPDTERPDCHRTKAHTYPSVYGRIYPDEPAQTLTTGFLSPGRGRFIHPVESRGLTPHEGARLQGFPDDFSFMGRRGKEILRQRLSHLIGDAVPPQLGYVVGLAALSIL